MDGMTSRGETSGHTQRLRSGDLGTLMRTGYHRTMEYVQARLEQLGFDDVRPAHMAIFQNLGPEGARIGELAERAKLTNQSVGYLVDYLEEHGYVERRPDPANRRATWCASPSGDGTRPTPARKSSTSSMRNSPHGWARNGWSSCRRCSPRRQRRSRRASSHTGTTRQAQSRIRHHRCCPAAAARALATYRAAGITRGQ